MFEMFRKLLCSLNETYIYLTFIHAFSRQPSENKIQVVCGTVTTLLGNLIEKIF